jgi:hypothetical protein
MTELSWTRDWLDYCRRSRWNAQPLTLRQTANVKRLVAMAFGRTDKSAADAQGCQMIEGQVRLHGWSRMRRVVIVRQRVRGASRASGASSTAGS